MASSVAGGDRAARVGDPLAPRAGVEARKREAGEAQGEQVVAGGDAGAAVSDQLVHRATAQQGGEPLVQLFRRKEAAVAAKVVGEGGALAPGMCPATGSMGSTSPRKRGCARASSSASPGWPSWAWRVAASINSEASGWPWKSPGRRLLSPLVSASPAASRPPGRHRGGRPHRACPANATATRRGRRMRRGRRRRAPPGYPGAGPRLVA